MSRPTCLGQLFFPLIFSTDFPAQIKPNLENKETILSGLYNQA